VLSGRALIIVRRLSVRSVVGRHQPARGTSLIPPGHQSAGRREHGLWDRLPAAQQRDRPDCGGERPGAADRELGDDVTDGLEYRRGPLRGRGAGSGAACALRDLR
jgi:hypothetical protein